MIYTILTTVGTSLFTNYLTTDEPMAGLQSLLDEYERQPSAKFAPDDFDSKRLLKHIERNWFTGFQKAGKYFLPGGTEDLNIHAAAELTSIHKIYELLAPEERKDMEVHVQFIATDTVASVLAAMLMKTFLEKPKAQASWPRMTEIRFDPARDVVEGLGVYPGEAADAMAAEKYYRGGMQNLIQKLVGDTGYITAARERYKPSRRGNSQHATLINFSGGYKAIIPILTMVAQVEKVPLAYIYDDSQFLSIWEDLPFQFDPAIMERYYPHYLLEEIYAPKDLEEADLINLAELCHDYQLYEHKESGLYVRTFLGDFISKYAYNNAITSPNVLGLFQEYKFLEFRYKHPDPENFQLVRRSVTFQELSGKKGQDGELDLVMEDGSGQWIVGECKSFLQVRNAFDERLNKAGKVMKNLRMQLERQFAFFKTLEESMPKEYHLYFYYLRQKVPSKKLVRSLLRLHDLIDQISNGQTAFRVFYVELNHRSKTPVDKRERPFKRKFTTWVEGGNPFKKSIQDGFRKEDIKEIFVSKLKESSK